MNKKYFIFSLAALSTLAMSADMSAFQREGCGGGSCHSGCGAPKGSYQGYNDLDGPYYDHRGPDVAPLYKDNSAPSPGARVPDNKKFMQFQGELPGAPSTGDKHHYFNPATVSMFKGEVLSVTEVDGFRGNKVVRVVVKTNQGDDVEIRLGPKSFIDEKSFSLSQGDKVDIKGSKVNWDGRSIIIAQEIKKDGKTLTLRDNDGKPSWKEDAERREESNKWNEVRSSDSYRSNLDRRLFDGNKDLEKTRENFDATRDNLKDTRSGLDKARQSWNETKQSWNDTRSNWDATRNKFGTDANSTSLYNDNLKRDALYNDAPNSNALYNNGSFDNSYSGDPVRHQLYNHVSPDNNVYSNPNATNSYGLERRVPSYNSNALYNNNSGTSSFDNDLYRNDNGSSQSYQLRSDQ